MNHTSPIDQTTTIPNGQINSPVLHGHCSKDNLFQTDGPKKRIRKRKPKIRITKERKTDMAPCLCSPEVESLKVESCITEPQTSGIPTNPASVSPETGKTPSQKSPKKSAGKRGKKQVVKSDNKPLAKEDDGCISPNTPGKGNDEPTQASVAHNPKNGIWMERKGTTNSYPEANTPSDQSKKEYNKTNRESLRTFNPRNQTQSIVDEDVFEDYMAPNVVEGLLQLPNYLQGVIRINQRMYTEAYISEPSRKRDILIEGIRNRNRALEGDKVVVAILPESEWKEISPNEKQQTGKVIFLLEAVHPRQAIGVLKPMPQKNSLQALFSPRDSRIPRMRVSIKECPLDFDKNGDQLFLARIMKWDNVRFARGSLMGGSIGIQGDIDVETQAILMENQIRSQPYPPGLIPKFTERLEKKDFKNRQDLRKDCIFSIDPLTARDLDDAVSCQDLENGNYLIGVHISDVSYYLEEDTPLDHLVAETATTTYLVQSVYHMLPREMTMKCSLLPGEDKLSFSVFWEIEETDTDIKVISHRFTRSVMNSCAQLAYEHAQMMLDNPDRQWKADELPTIHNGFTPEKLSSIVCTLNRLAIKLRNRRFETGCLRIDQTKLNFCLDEDGLPSQMAVYENKESHRLIEEFMLLANITVATTLRDAFPEIAFLRQHSPPLDLMLDKLKKQLELSGIIIDVSSAKSLQQSLTAYKDDNTVAGGARCVALNSLFSKPMARARYFCLSTARNEDEACHYALNVPIYTHFTSPIRRYADVMVHRLLAAYLGYSPKPSWTKDFVVSVASNCNNRKYSAKKAGEQSSELFLAVYLKNNGPLCGYAVVVDVKDHSFDAIFCSTGTIVRVYSDKVGAHVDNVKKQGMFSLVLSWFPSGRSNPVQQVISMFSIVNLQLKCSTTNTLKIEAVLLPPDTSSWEKLSTTNAAEMESSENKVEDTSSEPSNIDLSNFKLPDILDDVQECLYTSDDDLPSPESLCESPSPLEDKELKNVNLLSDIRRL